MKAGEWATVVAGRDGREGFLSVDGEEMVSGKSPGITRGLNLKTLLYVGGYNQQKIKLAPTVGLLEDSKGNVATFDGCIAMIEASGLDLDLVHSVVDSANVGECVEDSGVTDYHDLGSRIGDVDEVNGIDHGNDIFLSSKERNPCDAQPCLNGAFCLPAVHNASDFECHCAVGFRGRYCESTDTICDSHRPCQNGGTCISSSPSSYHCLCSLGYGGKNCDQRVEFGESVGFQGDGYLELSTTLLPHKSSNDLESIIMEFSTTSSNGLIFWHGQTPETDGRGQDFLAVAVVNGHLEFSYELGSGPASIRLDQTRVDDGKRHRVVFHREGKDGSIELDGADIKIGKSPGFLTMLNTLGNIYLGGLPKADYMTAGKYREGFSGCIHSIEIQDSGPINLYEKALSAVNAHPCSNDELDEELHRAL
ncbi:hypothetical protein J437_LFUL005763 [Ladona fulva]|uniref:Basement membrane-specific heparan sulfate proteoglycan core protein n=1 Tax=Ladona fulva TaxID=123851 RepID=A0A8K0K8C3_LADFU|nr:hypothetical protein J437_LFUL005763 [Ladona fulva]